MQWFKRLKFFDNSFDPDKDFFSLKIVRCVFIWIPVISFLVAVIIAIHSNLDWDCSYEGFNQALVIFKVPIGILATLIPIVALLASNHRSVQTKKQIELSKDQNNFINYFKHQEEFIKYCGNLEGKFGRYTVLDPHKLHGNMYYKLKDGDQDVMPLFTDFVDDLFEDVYKYLKMLNIRKKKCHALCFDKCDEIKKNLTVIFQLGNVEGYDSSGCSIYYNNKEYVFLKSSFREYIQDLMDLSYIIANILSFFGGSYSLENAEKIRRIIVSDLPDEIFNDNEYIVEPFDIDKFLSEPLDYEGIAKAISPEMKS